jgi:tRNA wybutosine-synthesizing protein 1
MNVAGMDATEDYIAEAHSDIIAREYLADTVIGVLTGSEAASRHANVTDADTNVDDVKSTVTKPVVSTTAGTVSATLVEKKKRVLVLYGSRTGTAKDFAVRFAEQVRANEDVKQSGFDVSVQNMHDFDPEDLPSETTVAAFVSTYTDGVPPADARFFFDWINDAVEDVRVENDFLRHVSFAVFGTANSLYEDHFNSAAKTLHSNFLKLGSMPIAHLGVGDANDARADHDTAEDDFKKWCTAAIPQFAKATVAPITDIDALKQAIAYDDTGDADADGQKPFHGVESGDEEADGGVMDLEDLGSGVPASAVDVAQDTTAATVANANANADADADADAGSIAISSSSRRRRRRRRRDRDRKTKDSDSKSGGSDSDSGDSSAQDEPADSKDSELREMVSAKIRKNLSKQGYRIIGSHSGVKICRWTKAMLRGRGGCYKHTFYGIMSYQCMEMTPSLACANKCVFCWRHHTNPVAKEWRWRMDEPDFILDEAISNHQNMIKPLKGVPGVQPERYADAFNVKHCALSLVGEPIMYPKINELLRLMHGKDISTFMVTNAQFPKAIKRLDPVTQLYVSVDAATKDSLKAVDRPLHKDFWERFVASLEHISVKKQRTVYRMTLVKDFNMEEIEAYAKLVSIGHPTFIEIKGVTFCGKLSASDLTMQNVPFHFEVRRFAQALCSVLGGQYELACEHVHSCCILICDTRFKIDGQWHTWIDYPKFQALEREYYETGKPFDAFDYMAPTPSWAVFGAKEEGFNPAETRVYRKSKKFTEAVQQKAMDAADAADDTITTTTTVDDDGKE